MIKNEPFPVDIIDEGENYYIIMDCPGAVPDSLIISGNEKEIIIKGIKSTVKGKKYILIERFRGKFLRKIKLPQMINIERTTAEYENGVLIIKTPKLKDEVYIDTSIKIKIIYRR